MTRNPHIPHDLPPDGIDWEKLISLIGEANRKIARYDGVLSGLINPRVLLSPLTTKGKGGKFYDKSDISKQYCVK